MYVKTPTMAFDLSSSPQILEIENDLRYLIEAFDADHHSPEEHKKILAIYDHLGVTYKAFKATIKQTEEAKAECSLRSRTQARHHENFMNDLEISWCTYDALVAAVKDIETEIKEWHHTNPETCVLDQSSQRAQKLVALHDERETAERARTMSDRLCADMTELAEQQKEELDQLRAEWQRVYGELGLLRKKACVFSLIMKRVERDIAPLLKAIGVLDCSDGQENEAQAEIPQPAAASIVATAAAADEDAAGRSDDLS